jgi:hypothetical protein
MAVIAECFALAGIDRSAEEHEVIYPANGVIEGVVAVRTLALIIGIRVIRIRYDVRAIHSVSTVAMG